MKPIDNTEATLVIHRHHIGYAFLAIGWVVAITTLLVFGVNLVFAIALIVAAVGGHILYEEFYHINSTIDHDNSIDVMESTAHQPSKA